MHLLDVNEYVCEWGNRIDRQWGQMEPGTSSCQDLQCEPLVPFLRWPESQKENVKAKLKAILPSSSTWQSRAAIFHFLGKHEVKKFLAQTWTVGEDLIRLQTNQRHRKKKILLFIFVLWKNSLERACRCNIIWFVEVYWFRLVNSTLTSANRTTFLLCCCWFRLP